MSRSDARARAGVGLALLALLAAVVAGGACTQGDPCLRHSDCPDEMKCAAGACVLGSRDGDDDTGTAGDGATEAAEAGADGVAETPADTEADAASDTTPEVGESGAEAAADVLDAPDAPEADVDATDAPGDLGATDSPLDASGDSLGDGG